MRYNKPALTIDQQIDKLKQRGLVIKDANKAAHYLSNISFYRLRAYTYPFQDNEDPDHPFIKTVTFEQIMSLYVFDRKLRLLVLDAIEKIEISLRTKMIYEFSIKHNPYWYCEKAHFIDNSKYKSQLDEINVEIDRSREDFIEHYKTKYDPNEYPPSWMALEIVSLGLLSKMYKNISSSCGTKRRIANYYGLRNESILENWIQCFSVIRNICAHHSRLWNRRAMPITMPNKPIHQFTKFIPQRNYKLYAYLSCIVYILKIINPDNTFVAKLKKIMSIYQDLNIKEMGFPENWLEDPFWA